MEKANKLSKRPDWKLDIEKDNENQKLIKEELICNLTGVVIKRLKIDILEKVLKRDKWQVKRDLVLKKK